MLLLSAICTAAKCHTSQSSLITVMMSFPHWLSWPKNLTCKKFPFAALHKLDKLRAWQSDDIRGQQQRPLQYCVSRYWVEARCVTASCCIHEGIQLLQSFLQETPQCQLAVRTTRPRTMLAWRLLVVHMIQSSPRL